MLYEALAGRVPFEADSAVAIAMKQVSHTPQRPSSINPRVSPALDAVVMRALEKDPGQRFQSAEAFIAALDAAMREPSGGAGGTAAFAPLPPPVVGPEEAAATEAEEERRRGRRLIWVLVAVAVLLGALLGFALSRDTTTEVPEVTGNQLGVAIALLEQNGFKVGEVQRVEREAPVNTVLEQSPLAAPPASQANLDCAFLSFFCSKPKVGLTVSSGPGTAKVPGTAGLSQEEAVAKLEEAGFEAKVEQINSEAVEAGAVIHSEPSAGNTATRGSTVTVIVSKGQKLVKVPVLVGTQRAVAVQQIRSRGLVPSVEEEESAKPAGEAIRQAPSAGSELPRGSGVSIVVSKGERKAKVPSVIGSERREAVEAMREAGLDPSVREEATEVPSQVGRAIDQFPPPGSEVEAGSAVTIVVGKAAPGAVEERAE
jgi:serine/threonine-protein kinase